MRRALAIDADMILRFLTNDDPDKAEACAALLEKACMCALALQVGTVHSKGGMSRHMKVALAIIRVAGNKVQNLSAMLEAIHEAAKNKADLVVFGEAVLTGLINNDDPTHDIRIGEPVPGPTVGVLGQFAKDAGIYVAAGMLERDGNCLYDTAVLIGPDGQVVLKYRRITPGWHGPNADSSVYRQGESIPRVETPLGSFAFLVCGDLFDESLTDQVRGLNVDWLPFPFARCFDDGAYDERRWDREERVEYARCTAKTGAVCLMVNYLADKELDGGSFGGAMIVGRDGSILAEMPLGEPGLLLVDV